MEEVEVYLGLGSNLGDRLENFRAGLEVLSRHIQVTRVSSIYETEPWGHRDQPLFLNGVCAGLTTLSPVDLLSALKEAEGELGREPSFPGGPRIFDADLLLYGDIVVKEPGLEVPHPRMRERAFVLTPLAEIVPHLVHPLERVTVGELLERVSGREGVVLWSAPPSLGD